MRKFLKFITALCITYGLFYVSYHASDILDDGQILHLMKVETIIAIMSAMFMHTAIKKDEREPNKNKNDTTPLYLCYTFLTALGMLAITGH